MKRGEVKYYIRQGGEPQRVSTRSIW